MIRDIGGVSTPPIRGGSFNSPHIYRGLWGEPLEGFLPQSSPYVGGRALYRAPLEVALVAPLAEEKSGRANGRQYGERIL